MRFENELQPIFLTTKRNRKSIKKIFDGKSELEINELYIKRIYPSLILIVSFVFLIEAYVILTDVPNMFIENWIYLIIFVVSFLFILILMALSVWVLIFEKPHSFK